MGKANKLLVIFLATLIISICLCSCGNNIADIKSTKVTLYGKTFSFPVKISELFDNGWSLPDNMNYTREFEPQKFTDVSGVKLQHNDGGKIGVTGVCNIDSTPKKLNDCLLISFTIEEDSINEFLGENAVVLPCNITAKSSYKDIVSAYGEPNETNKLFESASIISGTENGADFKTILYNNQINSEATYSFSIYDKGSICKIYASFKSPYEE